MQNAKQSSTQAPWRLLMAAAFVLGAALHLRAGDVKIIANPSVRADSISPAELRSVFLLQRKSLPDGSPVTPVLEKSGSTHEAFLKQFLDRDGQEIRIYYQGLVSTGKGTVPKELSSDAEVVAYVSRTRGAIGYVSSNTTTEGAKVLAVRGARGERALLTRVEPEYPETLRQLHIGGTVRLKVTIAANGKVEAVALLGGSPILGEAAMAAVRRWVYAVAPARTETEVTIPFDPAR